MREKSTIASDFQPLRFSLRPLPKTSQARKQVSPPDPSKPDMGLNGKPDGAQPQVKPKQDENPPKIVIKLGHKPVIINNTDATE